MKRKVEGESRIKKQATSMKKAVGRGMAVEGYYSDVRSKNKCQGRPEDEIDAHSRAVKNLGKRYAINKMEKGGEKAALSIVRTAAGVSKAAAKGGVYAMYSFKEQKHKELIKQMKEYIYANGTLSGSGLENKVDLLNLHERTELENFTKEILGKKYSKQEFLNQKHKTQETFLKQKYISDLNDTFRFNTLDGSMLTKQENLKETNIKNDSVADETLRSLTTTTKAVSKKEYEQLKAKVAQSPVDALPFGSYRAIETFPKVKQNELRQLNKRYRVLNRDKEQAAAKALLKKKVINNYQSVKQTEKSVKGLAGIFHGLKTAVKTMAASGIGMFVIGTVIILACIGVVVSSFVTNQMGAREQIIEVASKEIGTIGGDKYSIWYVGEADGDMWCARFVSWCADQCGLIEDGIFPKFQSCDAGLSWFKQKGLFSYTSQYGGVEYTPQIGDVIFFTGRNGIYDKNDSTHVGLVQGVENGQVLTIEGNTSNSVLPRRYSLNNPKILGYASPLYPTDVNRNTADFSGNDTAEIVWNFLKSMGCTDEAAAGIMGNIYGESSMNPGAIESNGEGHGLCQWSFGRKQTLFNRAEAAGKSWQDVGIQLTLLWDELNGLDATTANILNANYGGLSGLMSSTSIERATEAFCFAFERPSNASARVNQRIPYAKRYYELYAGEGREAA